MNAPAPSDLLRQAHAANAAHDIAAHLHPFTNLATHPQTDPLVITRGDGIFVEDAHHGDGTQNIFYGRADVLTVSTHADPGAYFPFYTGYAHEQGVGDGAGHNLNLPLPHGTGNAGFLQAVDQGVAAVRAFAPGALVLALGFDSYRDDPISVLKLDLDAYRQIGQRVAALGLPTVVVQEGGYLVEAIGPALDQLLQGLAAHG